MRSFLDIRQNLIVAKVPDPQVHLLQVLQRHEY